MVGDKKKKRKKEKNNFLDFKCNPYPGDPKMFSSFQRDGGFTPKI